MNALYCDREGTIFDPLGGHDDLINRRVRFIGEPGDRIKEDYLRILRFFRFFAWYGSTRPDAAGLKACARLKENIESLSVERVWSELKKLLSAKDPSRALLWMRTSGVLSVALPETEKWGIDRIHGLIAAENDLNWPVDPMLRLMAIIPDTAEVATSLAARLKLSTRELEILTNWASTGLPSANISSTDFDKLLYQTSLEGMANVLKLELVRQRQNNAEVDNPDALEALTAKLDQVEAWERPQLPVRGRDLIEAGYDAGPELGKRLKKLENEWIESGFKLTKKALLNSL